MARLLVTDELLDEVQNWATHRLGAEEYHLIFGLIEELRRLRKRAAQNIETSAQCEFMRAIAGHQFRCAARAKYGRFCGFHKPRKSKQRSKGCVAKNRAGVACKGVVLRDDLCPTHWQKAFGHDYQRSGQGFRCGLCGEMFDYWTVEGKGRDRIGSIKRVAICAVKAQKSQ